MLLKKCKGGKERRGIGISTGEEGGTNVRGLGKRKTTHRVGTKNKSPSKRYETFGAPRRPAQEPKGADRPKGLRRAGESGAVAVAGWGDRSGW